MGSLSILEIPYRAAMSGDWKSMLDHYQGRVLDVPFPVTLSADTVNLSRVSAEFICIFLLQKQGIYTSQCTAFLVVFGKETITIP
jgi:hypothetical protein